MTGLREVFTSFSLFLVVGSGLLTELAGVSMALGTFMAGVLLADSEYRHELELNIEPFKGLLMGLFFIAVGMTVDIGLFIADPIEILMLVGALMAVKGLVLLAIARSAGFTLNDQIFFALFDSASGRVCLCHDLASYIGCHDARCCGGKTARGGLSVHAAGATNHFRTRLGDEAYDVARGP